MSTEKKPSAWRRKYWRVVAVTTDGKRPFYYTGDGPAQVNERIRNNSKILEVVSRVQLTPEQYSIATGRPLKP